MRRRHLLSVVGAGLLAGCGGTQSADGESDSEPVITTHSGPANFADVEISGPDTVEVGDDVEFTVRASNTGGDTGDFTATFTAGTGAFTSDQSVTIEDVPPGERAETTVGPWPVTRARDYTVRITDHGAEHTVSGETRVADGDTLDLGDIEITVADVEVAERLFTADGIAWSDKGVLLVATVSASGGDAPSPESFELNGDGPVVFGSGYDKAQFPSEGDRTVYDAESGAGSVVWDMTADAVVDGAELTVNLDYSDSTEPEGQLALDGMAVPDLTSTVTIADSLRLTDDAGVAIEATNNGDADATYKGRLVREGSYADEAGERISEPVPAGESIEVTHELPVEQEGEARFRVIPDTRMETVVVEPGELELGGSYIGSSGLRVTVEDISPEYPDYEYRDTNGDIQRVDHSAVFVVATFENTTDEELSTPSQYMFGPQSGRVDFQNQVLEYASPDYSRLPLGATIEPGESFTGAIPYTGTDSEIVVVYNDSDGWGSDERVMWSEDSPQN